MGLNLTDSLQELTSVAATLAGSTRASVSVYDARANKVFVLLHTLFDHMELDGSFRHPFLSKERPVLLLNQEEYAKVYQDHPLRTMSPQIKSIAVYQVYTEPSRRWSLSLANPTEQFFQDDRLQTAVERIKLVMETLIRAAEADLIRVEMNGAQPLLAQPVEVLEVSLRFLLETLPTRQRLLSRNDIAYIALRSWRKPIKDYQLQALKAIKHGHIEHAAATIAKEMLPAVVKDFGRVFDCVVPVPSGSSGREEGLSHQLGENLAQQLGIEFQPVLIGGPVPHNGSHPKKSTSLKPYELKKPVKGHVLLVDDVATSGRHLELACHALKQSAQAVNAMTWIAD